MYTTERKLQTASEIFHPVPFDYDAHNRENREVWDSFFAGDPVRMPMILGVNHRHIILDRTLNPEGVTYRDIFEDPFVMLQVGLRFDWYMRHFLRADREMGPSAEGYGTGVHFMNTCEAEWFGATREYIGGDLPEAHPFLHDDNKNMLFEKGIPDPFYGLAGTAREYTEFFRSLHEQGYTYEGMPIKPPGIGAFMGTDGPLTVACAIRGATEMCMDFYEDPEYAHALLQYITEATIARIRAWRRYYGQPERTKNYGFADDSIALISMETYKEFVYPYHVRLMEALSEEHTDNSVHLCGDASRFFEFMHREMCFNDFDTGFPIDHAAITKALPDCRFNGGVKVDLLLQGTPDQVYDETVRIIRAVTPNTRRFVMREANNLAPRTPERNIDAMYRAVKEHGRYR